MKKKISVSLLILFVILISVISLSKISEATSIDGPNFVINTNKEEILAYKDIIFKVDFNIKTGEIKDEQFVDNTDEKSKIIKTNNNKIKLKTESGLEIIGVSGEVKNYGQEYSDRSFKFTSDEIDLGELTYKYNNKYETVDGKTKYSFEGPDIKLTVSFKSKVENTGGLKLKENLDFLYSDAKGVIINDKMDNECKINIQTINYQLGKIDGLGLENINEYPVHMPVYRTFNIKYKLGTGKFDKPIENMNTNSRDLIYVVDLASLDLIGGNDETARVSMIKGLEELLKTNPNVKTTLITYGEQAKIISVDGKSKFSILQLIDEINKLESVEKSGNLGDAIRKAKYVSNENSDSDSSIIIVSSGNPHAYTQISKDNEALLEDRSNKNGVVNFDENIAEKYANNIVNDIVISENDDTRWYSVNYGVSKDEVLINDLIDKLDGFTTQIKNPYYDDFARINKSSVIPFEVGARVECSVKEEYEDILEVVENTEKINIGFNADLTAVQENYDLNVKLKFVDMPSSELLENGGINMAKVLDLTVIKDNKSRVEFKPSNEDIWTVIPQIDYLVESGFYRGAKERVSSDDDFNLIATKLIQESDQVDLAVENYFGFGAILSVENEPISIKPKIKGVEDNKFKIYKLEGGNASEGISFDSIPKGVYLITRDYLISGSEIGETFEIGIDISGDFRGLTVTAVDKPEHF